MSCPTCLTCPLCLILHGSVSPILAFLHVVPPVGWFCCLTAIPLLKYPLSGGNSYSFSSLCFHVWETPLSRKGFKVVSVLLPSVPLVFLEAVFLQLLPLRQIVLITSPITILPFFLINRTLVFLRVTMCPVKNTYLPRLPCSCVRSCDPVTANRV